MVRISIAGLLGMVAVFAIGFAALVNASDLWLGATLTLTIGLLLGSVLGVILRPDCRGGGLLVGFALFGWGFFLLGLAPAGLSDHLRGLSDTPARWAFEKANALPVRPPPYLGPDTPTTTNLLTIYNDATRDFRNRRANAGVIGQWLTVLLMAMVGAIAGAFLARGRPSTPMSSPSD